MGSSRRKHKSRKCSICNHWFKSEVHAEGMHRDVCTFCLLAMDWKPGESESYTTGEEVTSE